jgi:hypothetical protein
LSLPFEESHGILALLSAHREGIMLRQNNWKPQSSAKAGVMT